jgi:hypothetical protein
MQSHTYKDIAKRNQCDKRTVQGWANKYKAEHGQELGKMLNGCRVFSDEDRALLEQYRRFPMDSAPAAKVVEVLEVEALPTTALAVMDVSQFDIGAALANLDGSLGSALENSRQVVDAVKLLCDRVASTLEDKVAAQRQQVAQDTQQLIELEAAKEDFQRRVARAAVRSKSLAAEQTNVTDDIQSQAQEIFSLGKSPVPSESP